MSKKKSKNKGLIKGFRGLIFMQDKKTVIRFSDIRMTIENPDCMITYIKIGKKKVIPKIKKIEHSKMKEYKVHILTKTPSFIKEYVLVNENQNVVKSHCGATYTDYIRSNSDKRYGVFNTNEQLRGAKTTIKYTIPLQVYINSLRWGNKMESQQYKDGDRVVGESVAVKDLKSDKLIPVYSAPVNILIECPDKRFIVMQ